MVTFRIVELNSVGVEDSHRDFESYEECLKAFKKQRKFWRKFAEETAKIKSVIKEHTPFCYSLYQYNEPMLTWQMTVIPFKSCT